MKVKNIDLGNAFEKLKESLIKSENIIKLSENPQTDYARAYGTLSANVQYFIFWNTDLPTMQSVLMEEVEQAPDDIPPELFKKPGIYGYNPD